MENQRMLSTQEAVVGGTEGGPGPTGVPPTTAAAEGAGGSGPGVSRPPPQSTLWVYLAPTSVAIPRGIPWPLKSRFLMP
jgi:hypothetical protein